jgi:hypothetical protein
LKHTHIHTQTAYKAKPDHTPKWNKQTGRPMIGAQCMTMISDGLSHTLSGQPAA